ncbi:MAG: hypothetical protein FJ319_02815 [SAR202 cluster bacterium]|nr:hypothetical protein [SAR202 cluster bacterium]
MVVKTKLSLNTTPGTHVLFLDMQEIAATKGVVQAMCEAKKHPLNPVIPLGDLHEWDSMRASPWAMRSAIYDKDEKIFKFWYGGKSAGGPHRAGYALSEDGVHREKPNMGLHEWGGNKNNNILFGGLGSIMKDYGEPDPAKRYKALVKTSIEGEAEGPSRMGYSADGIHWDFNTFLDMNRMLSPQSLGLKQKYASPCALVRDDQATDPNRRYQAWWMSVGKTQKPELPGKEWVRTKSLAFSPDALNWTSARTNPAMNPEDGAEMENHFLMAFPYRGYYVMFYEHGWYSNNRFGGKYGTYCSDLRLAVSRDGENYTRILADQKVVARGKHGEWDSGFMVPADQPVMKDDTIYIYYGRSDDSYPGFAGDQTHFYAQTLPGDRRLNQTGLATLTLDRITCLRSFDGEMPGWAVTQPIEVVSPANTRLILNVSEAIPNRSWVDVEVLDTATMEPIPGYTRNECRPLARDGIRMPVQWESEATLAGVKAGRIALKFGIYGNAKLHSFTFAEVAMNPRQIP